MLTTCLAAPPLILQAQDREDIRYVSSCAECRSSSEYSKWSKDEGSKKVNTLSCGGQLFLPQDAFTNSQEVAPSVPFVQKVGPSFPPSLPPGPAGGPVCSSEVPSELIVLLETPAPGITLSTPKKLFCCKKGGPKRVEYLSKY